MRHGFEIEIEDIERFPPDIPGIRVTEDNSLRNGREFVSDILPDVPFTKSLYRYTYDKIGGNYSERCGFHFHMDVTNKNKTSKMEFLKRYIQVERTLFKHRPDILRADNNFCNLLLDSQEEINIIRSYNIRDRNPSNYSKYSALNIKTMMSIGTFEFRALCGGVTPDDFDYILDIFQQLWDKDAPLPLEDLIEEGDRQEAEAVIGLLNTQLSEEPPLEDEFMNDHFRTEPTISSSITETDIREYLNSM